MFFLKHLWYLIFFPIGKSITYKYASHYFPGRFCYNGWIWRQFSVLKNHENHLVRFNILSWIMYRFVNDCSGCQVCVISYLLNVFEVDWLIAWYIEETSVGFFYKQCVLTFRCILRQLGCCLIHLYPTTKVSYMLHSSRKHGIQVNVSWKIIFFLFNSFYLCLISILYIFSHKTLILRNTNSNKNMYMISYFLYLQLLK